MYEQRLNGRLQGALDFWLTAGLERDLGGAWSLEASVRHLCRHATSRDNPVILDVNEVLGFVRRREKGLVLGLGAGSYIGKTGDFRHLAAAELVLSDAFGSGIAFEGEVKWVNFAEWLYEAGFSIALGPGTALFLRGARTYRFPSTLQIGFRYDSLAAEAGPLTGARFSAGVTPTHDRFKLTAAGDYRLLVWRKNESRLIMDAGFHSPVLTGDGFFAQFRPDRLIYDLRGEYERTIGSGLFVSWYAAYRVNMPADKAIPFTGALATGLSIKNQTDFERLDRGFRFESSVGWNFKSDGEMWIRAGVNTIPEKGPKLGSSLTFHLIGRGGDEIDWNLFIDTGGVVSARPFIGLRNEPALGGGHSSDRLTVVAGIGLFKWF